MAALHLHSSLLAMVLDVDPFADKDNALGDIRGLIGNAFQAAGRNDRLHRPFDCRDLIDHKNYVVRGGPCQCSLPTNLDHPYRFSMLQHR